MVKVIFIAISVLLCFGLPITWFLLVRHQQKGYFGLLVAGALSFYLTQMVVRLPLLQLVMPKLTWYQNLSENLIGIGLFLGFTAALFETAGRWLTLNFLLKKRLSYRSGIVHGIGHGGIEAILLVGINYVFYGIYTYLYTKGVETPMLFMFPDQAQDMMKTLIIDTESYLFLVAGFERVLTMVVHVALSLLMTIGIIKGRPLVYTLWVLLMHGSLDFFAVVMSGKGVSVWLIELVVLSYALLSTGIIIKFRGKVQEGPDMDEGERAVDEGY